jgi:starch phosphorylase
MERNGHLLNSCGFFGKTLTDEELQKEVVNDDMLNYTVAALRMAKRANAVSRLHAVVANNMWNSFKGTSKIIPITNSQNQHFWQDSILAKAWKGLNAKAFKKRKLELKTQLFDVVLDQTGKLFDPNILTIVWARRFAQYKRADLLLYDLERFEKLVSSVNYPVQVIWAGKPYPTDYYSIDMFNHLVNYTKFKPNMAVLIGYEMELSRKLKKGSDVWLNTPRITREASGTSGMTAAMNGSLNLTINDGWIPEFAVDGVNSFVLPEADYRSPAWEQDKFDSDNLYNTLEKRVIPTFYEDPKKWQEMVFKGIDGVVPAFTSRRMADEYYNVLYK